MVVPSSSGAPAPAPRFSGHTAGCASVAPYVIKLGGSVLEDVGAVRELGASLLGLGSPVVVVHGGGREVSDWCRRLGQEPRFQRGRRVTDAAALDVAAAVLRGLANARLVASLRVAGVNAVGLGAADGGLAEVELHPDAATIGQVGTVTAVRAELLQRLLDTGFTPVVSSIGARDGRLLNLNADELAGALAAATRASALFLLSDVEGLRLDGRLVLDLGRDAVPSLLARDDVRDGMIPKLEAAAAALAGGAERVLIGAWHGPGTLPELLSGRLRATHVWPTPTEVAHG